MFKEHPFWDHQPVRQVWKKSFVAEKDGPYVKSRDVTKVATEAIELPANFEWCKIDLNNDMEVLNLCVFLQQNVQTILNQEPKVYTPQYSIEWIRWLLSGPESTSVCIGVKSKGKLMGFIGGSTMKLSINKETMTVAEINFLTIHTKLRGKRLAPVMIKEIQRRFNLEGVWQGMFSVSHINPGVYASN